MAVVCQVSIRLHAQGHVSLEDSENPASPKNWEMQMPKDWVIMEVIE